jgi:DNA-binding NtrC family response regulator/tetratricopeptide (TPR) repeat protein
MDTSPGGKTMTTVLARADSLMALLQEKTSDQRPQPFVEAAIRLCEDLILAGESPVALSLLAELEPLCGSFTPETVVQTRTAEVAVLNSVGRFAEALELAETIESSGAAVLQRLPDTAHRLQILVGTSLWLLNRPEETIRRLTRVRDRLLMQPDSHLLADCSIQLSAAHSILGDFRTARHFALDGLVSARRSGNKAIEGIALENYAMLERLFCRWAEAAEATEASMRIHEASGNKKQLNHSRRGLAILRWRRGRLESALQLIDTCIARRGDSENPIALSFAKLVKAVILIHQGRFATASELCESIAGWNVPTRESMAAMLAREYVGDAKLEQGDAAGALLHYEDVYPKALAVSPRSDLVAELRRRLAECYYLLGRHDEAYAEARVTLEHCRGAGDRYEEAATYRILALSAGAVGRPDEAKKWFDEGFAHFDEIETPYEWGKLWMAYGDWLLGPHAGAHADHKGALEAYYAARNHFEGMGAEAKLAEVKGRIERLVQPQGDSRCERVADANLEGVRHTPRRPRRSTELDRRSAWAFETFKMVTRNKTMLALLDDVGKLAASQTPMLVLGESGTGKELIARGIHALSLRKGTFMAINAGSLPREIIESELFGHVAGSFTGASRDKPGMFEVCDKGTAFLDEIAEMPVELQSRLLRYLETGESRRVGANANIAVDTRIIAATNRERGALERGEGFRLDLYYRLAHAVIVLPPLRQRGQDVELLVGHFLEEACTAANRQVRLSPAAFRRLADYSWPGNIRQLRSVIKRVVLLGAEGHDVTPEKLELENAEVPTTLIEELEQSERRRVGEALSQAHGSRTVAAKILGVPRTTLINRVKRYGLT